MPYFEPRPPVIEAHQFHGEQIPGVQCDKALGDDPWFVSGPMGIKLAVKPGNWVFEVPGSKGVYDVLTNEQFQRQYQPTKRKP